MRAKTNNLPEIEDYEGGIDITDFLSRLDKVKKVGKFWIARCPAHKDGRPSLRISQGEKCILVKCWVGCTYHEIVEAMDLRPQDLFTDALTVGKKAEYWYRGLLAKIKKIDTTLWFYEHDMNKGLLDDAGKAKYRDYISEIHSLRREAYDLRTQHGFPE